ncbi:MFS transporter- SP family- general alpha glucoside:H+ symporter [Apiospora kogelbergensis]|uniref:MFS transporter- SP family- general alpha glucoside:H+ symporter n=1 Tax=Apiospora kogelbergensis TaxID=1337665 RepID=UPI00312F41E4
MANESKSLAELDDGDTAAVAPASGAVRLDDEVLTRMAAGISNFGDIMHDAHTATEYERNMTLREALRLYPKAIAFSMVLSATLVMEGYDTALLKNLFAYPAFRERFGQPVEDGSGSYQLTASWQSGLQAMVQVGEIVGLYLAGILAENHGYRKTLLGSLVFVILAIFMLFFAQNLGMLMAGEFLCGLPWGGVADAEHDVCCGDRADSLAPLSDHFRQYVCQLISQGVLSGLLYKQNEWGWRIPFAIQWAWPLPIIIGVLLAPESPWWLIQKGRIEDARKVLRSLVSAKNGDYSVDRNVAMMIYTDAHERAVAQGTSYSDCFKGADLRRTEIACCTWLIQIGCGIWFGGNVTYFLQQAGFDDEQSFKFGLGHNAVNVFGTFCSWWLMQHAGRRSMYLWGLVIMLVLLLAVGFTGIPEPSESIAYVSGSLLMLFTLTYGVTVGPVCYCLVSEMPSTRLRIKTVALARNAYNVMSIAANFLNNPILNPTAWNLRGKGGFVWSGFCLISYVWAYYRLPEPRGLSAGEMDVLFQQRVPARRFTKVRADPFLLANLDVGVPQKGEV